MGFRLIFELPKFRLFVFDTVRPQRLMSKIYYILYLHYAQDSFQKLIHILAIIQYEPFKPEFIRKSLALEYTKFVNINIHQKGSRFAVEVEKRPNCKRIKYSVRA